MLLPSLQAVIHNTIASVKAKKHRFFILPPPGKQRRLNGIDQTDAVLLHQLSSRYLSDYTRNSHRPTCHILHCIRQERVFFIFQFVTLCEYQSVELYLHTFSLYLLNLSSTIFAHYLFLSVYNYLLILWYILAE